MTAHRESSKGCLVRHSSDCAQVARAIACRQSCKISQNKGEAHNTARKQGEEPTVHASNCWMVKTAGRARRAGRAGPVGVPSDAIMSLVLPSLHGNVANKDTKLQNYLVVMLSGLCAMCFEMQGSRCAVDRMLTPLVGQVLSSFQWHC